MPTEKKLPYRYENCLIYTTKNRKFLEGFATALSYYPLSEKLKLHNKSIATGGIKYLALLSAKHKVMLVSDPGTSKNKHSTIFLAEE
jgi:hypothetical protein